MNRIAYLACALGLALVGCRDNGGGGDDDPNPDGPPGGTEVTVQEVQADAMPSGTQVTLKGVVVTAIDSYGNRTGDLWVQEPGGGEFSGVKVFGAPLDQVALLQPGDLVDITNAQKDEFALMEDMSGLKVTELKPVDGGTMSITKTGTGTVPAPATVDAKAIAALPTRAERDAEWEKWEGVLIRLTNARQLGAISTFGSTPGPDSTEFRATSFVRVQSALVELPVTSVAGTCYDGITGIGDYFFNWILAPRTAADLVGGGSGCNPMAESISALQTASTPPEMVQLTDVYVSALSFNKKHLWLTTSLTAAPNEGVYVYRGSSAATLPTDVVVGARVSVIGSAEEFDGLNGGDTITQVTTPTITVTAPPTTPPVPVTGVSVSGMDENYESVLVTLTNVKVNMVGSGSDYIADLAQYPGNLAFKADDDIYRIVAGDANACWASVTGLWSYNGFADTYVFLPLSAGTGTGTCQ